MLQNSLAFTLVVACWDFVCRLFGDSLTGVAFHRLSAFWRRGFISRSLSGGEGTRRAWTSSWFYRFLTAVTDFIPDQLGKRMPQSLSRSLTFRTLAALGRNSWLLMGLMLMLLLTVPQALWNNLYSLFLVAAVLGLFLIAGAADKSLRIDWANVGLWPVLFGLVSCLSLLWSQVFHLSFRFLFFNITCILVVVLCVSAVSKEDQLYGMARLLCMGLIACCAYALYQSYLGVDPSESFTDLSVNAHMPGRVFSFFENPNAFANILVYFAPLMFALTFYGKRGWHRLLFAGAFLLCFLAIFMTGSRGGWLALAVSGLVLVLFLCPRWVPLFLLLIPATVPFWPASITSRLMTIFSSDSSINGRTYIYTAVARIIGSNWLLGVGLGTWALRWAVAYYDTYFAAFPFIHAHNVYMQVWAESGIFALIAFLGALIVPLAGAAQAVKHSASATLRAMAAGCASGIIGFLVFGITDYAWTYPRIMVLFWFLFAMLLCTVKLHKSAPGATTQKEGTDNV